VKRWDALAVATVAALSLLAPMAQGADVLGYTFSVPVSAKGAYAGYHQFQMGKLNNKGQLSFDMINSADSAERIFVWDGKQVIMLSDSRHLVMVERRVTSCVCREQRVQTGCVSRSGHHAEKGSLPVQRGCMC